MSMDEDDTFECDRCGFEYFLSEKVEAWWGEDLCEVCMEISMDLLADEEMISDD